MSLRDQLQAIKDQTVALKPAFVEYISNKTIPLSDRWDVFVLADNRLKEHKPYGPGFSALDSEVVGQERVIHMVRECSKDTCVLIAEITDKLNNIDDVASDYQADLLLAIDIIELKEEILSENCGSFTFDF